MPPCRPRIVPLVCSIGLAAAFLGCGSDSPAPGGSPAKTGGTSLILATASTGGTYYPVGVAIATLVNENLAASCDISVNAISSAGSGENIQLLKGREADLAILQGLFGAMAWQGKGKYRGKPERAIRSITMLWENVEHFTVLAQHAGDGNIMALRNAKGRPFSIGRRGSGSEISGRTILTQLGIDVDKDFRPEHVGYVESAAAMQNGRLAGMNTPAGPPVAAVTQAFAAMGAGKLAILEFSDDQVQAVNRAYPVWSRYVIPANTYPKQTQSIHTIAQPNFLAAHPDLAEDVVYRIVKTIYENLPFLHGTHRATLAMGLERAVAGLPVPLHPGAARYYREQGIHIPQHLLATP